MARRRAFLPPEGKGVQYKGEITVRKTEEPIKHKEENVKKGERLE